MRELRLIALHKPRYNRRSRFPEKVHWIKLTDEPWPRLSLVRQVLDDADEGRLPRPVPVAQGGREVPGRAPRGVPGAAVQRPAAAACRAVRPASWPRWTAASPPATAASSATTYAAMVGDLRDNLVHRADEVVEALTGRMATLALGERYEEATVHRDRLAAFVRAATRTQRLSALTGCSEMVAARREDDGRWAVHVVRHGRLAAAGVIPPGTHAGEYVSTLRAGAETVLPGPGPTPAATAEETEKVLRWLESPGIRLVHLDGEWACPIRGAGPARVGARRGQHLPRSRWCRSTSAATCHCSTNRPDDRPGNRHDGPSHLLGRGHGHDRTP